MSRKNFYKCSSLGLQNAIEKQEHLNKQALALGNFKLEWLTREEWQILRRLLETFNSTSGVHLPFMHMRQLIHHASHTSKMNEVPSSKIIVQMRLKQTFCGKILGFKPMNFGLEFSSLAKITIF